MSGAAGGQSGGLDVPAIVARAAVHQRGAVLLAVLVLVLLGATAASDIPIDAVPDITNVQVVVLTRAPGFGPVEVERLVTHPVEVGVAGIPGIREVRSTSRTGLSSVTIVFEDDTDPLLARLQVSQRLPGIVDDLPAQAEAPELGPFTTGLGEVYHFTVRWPGHSMIDTHTLVEWELAHPMRLVPGVVEVNSWGGEPRRYEVRLDPQRMAARGVTLFMVSRALEQSNRNVGAGAIERNGAGVVVRGEGLLENIAQIGGVEVRREEQVPVLVRDVADVQIGSALRLGSATADGRGEVVYVMVQMLAGANARAVVAAVRARLAELEAQLPPGVVIERFYDRADFVHRVLTTVEHNLLEGAVLVILVLLVALGNLRAGLLVASLIPLSAVIAAYAIRRLGLSGNLMSLGAVDFGLLVDGGVVMVEHVLAMAQRRRDEPADLLVREAAGEVARPVAYGVAIIGLVYLPVLTLEGVEGRMFRPMAIVVLCALGASLVLSLTLLPALAPGLVQSARRQDIDKRPPVLLRVVTAVFRPVLGFGLRFPAVVGIGVAAFVVLAGVMASRRGAEFTPRLDEGSLAIQLTRPPATSLEEGTRGALTVEQTLRHFPEVTRVVSRTGSPAVATDLMGPEQSDVFVMLRPPETWRRPYDREALVAEMNGALGQALPGCEFSFTQPIEMRMAELLSGIRSDVGVRIAGEDMEVLRALGDRVADVLRSTPGGQDVRAEQVDGLPTLTVRPDQAALARQGLHSGEVLDYVQALRAGVGVGRIFEGERRFDLALRVAGGEGARQQSLMDLPLPRDTGELVTLRAVATASEQFGPAQVSHEGGVRRLIVEANVRGRDLGSYVSEVQRRLAREVRAPRGYTLRVGGQYQNMVRAARRLMLVVPIALLAILIMLRASLGRWSTTLLVFLNVPVAASGGVVALAARGMPFSITAGVGFVALAGIAVLNGLVLCTEIDRLRSTGLSPREAAGAGAQARLRPVLTTALVAALGFVPMALARGTGAEVQRPLATVIIGGLFTATLATLLLLPALASRQGRPRGEQTRRAGRHRGGSRRRSARPGGRGAGAPGRRVIPHSENFVGGGTLPRRASGG
jgi:cobalt-zinc-cadmium resistance protein CzcA